MKKVAILQSDYIPWKGYFDIINSVDEFILYDDMQYTRRDWRNRNQIKTANGMLWLTIPVDTKGKYFQKINETKVSGHRWTREHMRAIQLAYAHAPYYDRYKTFLEELYAKADGMDSAPNSESGQRSPSLPIMNSRREKRSAWRSLSGLPEETGICQGLRQRTTSKMRFLRRPGSGSPI